MATDKPRITVSIDEETMQKIENLRFAERFPNRSATVEYLIQKGLESVTDGTSAERQ